MHIVWKFLSVQGSDFSPKLHDNFGKKSGFDATMDDNIQLEYNLRKMNTEPNNALIEQEAILHFNTNTLSYSMGKMELTLHTYMLSLLL